jgi:hypothetical protein
LWKIKIVSTSLSPPTLHHLVSSGKLIGQWPRSGLLLARSSPLLGGYATLRPNGRGLGGGHVHVGLGGKSSPVFLGSYGRDGVGPRSDLAGP